ncbi:uncharacterized protein Dana_GF24035, isoform B [Drosophila ananassae]|uniref:Uncharacterized protein, isoform B n=1 Tax=Drosophila ananassae TaxID=7217 RepID=A0A0P9C421_DROAN|nr:uncharacterized protein Dana_GF24035, isoform B [Drosophila ananassae]
MSLEKRRSSNRVEVIEVVVRPKKYYPVGRDRTEDGRDKIFVSKYEKFRIFKNVIILSLAMMTQYVAYQGTLNLQSSLNAEDGLGTIACSCIYLSMGLSCLFLPTLMIRQLTCKGTLVLGMFCFLPYIGLQLFSSKETIGNRKNTNNWQRTWRLLREMKGTLSWPRSMPKYIAKKLNNRPRTPTGKMTTWIMM